MCFVAQKVNFERIFTKFSKRNVHGRHSVLEQSRLTLKFYEVLLLKNASMKLNLKSEHPINLAAGVISDFVFRIFHRVVFLS